MIFSNERKWNKHRFWDLLAFFWRFAFHPDPFLECSDQNDKPPQALILSLLIGILFPVKVQGCGIQEIGGLDWFFSWGKAN
jgi:hypothetical protein